MTKQDKNTESSTQSTTNEKTRAEQSSSASSPLPNFQELGQMAKAVFGGINQGIKQAVNIYKEGRKPGEQKSETPEEKGDKSG